ncbi:MAG: HAMP domain-containing protein [Planctomycetes bacterium]|nr:HAMP domain-containing protein [Planctomycetota bacterium]
MTPKTLSGRIFLACAAIIAVLLLLVSLLGERRLLAFHESEVKRRLQTAATLFSDAAARLLSERAGASALTPDLELARAEGLRLTVLTLDGAVLADSDAPPPLADHSGRPELVAAERDGEGTATRKSATTGLSTFYLARRLDAGGKPIGFVRVAAGLGPMKESINDLRDALLLSGMAALVLGLAAAAVVARWLGKPLKEIQRTASQIAAGSLNQRIRVSGPAEARGLASCLNDLAEQIRRWIETLERRKRETEAIHASMSEGVIAVDPRERILLMNDAAARILGLPRPLPAGAQLWQEVRFPDLERALRAALTAGARWRGDAPRPGRDERILALSVTRVDPGIGAVALLSDVTEIRRLDKVRGDFVANVSHEMRTPLTAVLGALETLAMPAQSAEDQARFLDIARRNALRMQAIVADLLELSRIEVEGDRMPMAPLSLDEPVHNAVSALSMTAEAKGIELSLHVPPATSLWVNGNEKRLEQVFTNLIDNAIKYTPAGGRVEVRLARGETTASVSVADTGIGMPASALPRIFERFYRVDKSRSRDMGGTGLGLAIVKHCVKAHGAEVRVESTEGAGSTFTVSLAAIERPAGAPAAS